MSSKVANIVWLFIIDSFQFKWLSIISVENDSVVLVFYYAEILSPNVVIMIIVIIHIPYMGESPPSNNYVIP